MTLAQRWRNVVHLMPTVTQLSDHISTIFQRWANVVMLSGSMPLIRKLSSFGCKVGFVLRTSIIILIKIMPKLICYSSSFIFFFEDVSCLFDKGSHLKLIFKLWAHGVKENKLYSISVFIWDQTQIVVLEGQLSSEVPAILI